ncbi:MAG: hypothetical protein SVY53_00260 [Chloroflexota bacterium]|nr:hypothetical protein [Chloroflexota bacterium]
MRFAISALVIMVFLFFYPPPPIAAAAGVGVSPGELDFEVISEVPVMDALTIANTHDNKSSYHVYAEGEYGDWFEITPEEFSLSPNETSEVIVKVLPLATTQGNHTAKICIVSFDPSSDLAVGAGVKVRANITVPQALPGSSDASSFPWLHFVLAMTLIILMILVFTFVMLRRKGQNADGQIVEN